MAKYERITRCNDLRFIVANDQLPELYNTWPFDKGFYEEKIREYQRYIPYCQKRNTGDFLTIYFDSLAPNALIHFLDEEGTVLNTLDYGGVPSATVAGNIAPNGTDYNTYTVTVGVSSYFTLPPDHAEAVFYVVIECVYPDETNSYYVSEPVHVMRGSYQRTIRGGKKNFEPYTKTVDYSGHPGTQLVEATHTENEYDILFEYFPDLIFQQRIESSVEYQNPTSNDTIFEDQSYRSRTIHSVPADLYRWRVGGDEGIPDYLWDKLNRLMSFDNFKIDFSRYTKPDGAKWNDQSENNYPLRHSEIDLLEYDPLSGTIVGEDDPLLLIEFVLGEDSEIIFPSAINQLWLVGDSPTFNLSDEHVFESDIDIDNFVTYLNTVVIPAAGAAGTVVRAGNKIFYNRGLGETHYLGPGTVYFYKRLEFTIQTGSTLTSLVPDAGKFVYQVISDYGLHAQTITDWGDGQVDWWMTSGTANIYHTYNQTGVPETLTLRVFHAGPDTDGFTTISSFSLSTPVGEPKVRAIISSTHVEAPPYLRVFKIGDHDLTGVSNVDTSFLATCATWLYYVVFHNCNIGNGVSSFVPELFDYPGDPIFPNLSRVWVRGNKLSSGQVDTMCISIFDHTITPHPTDIMHIYIDYNTPPAPPTGTSALVRSYWALFSYDLSFD